jgi:hypothetical protein
VKRKICGPHAQATGLLLLALLVDGLADVRV